MRRILKKGLIVFLSFVLSFAPAYALANTSALNGWSIANRAMQGATRLYDGAKTAIINGASVAKTSTARLAPTAAQVAKGIVRTGAVLAVSVAIESLIGAVDYVMDPANNRVIYHDNLFIYVSHAVSGKFKSSEEACIAALGDSSLFYSTVKTHVYPDGRIRYSCRSKTASSWAHHSYVDGTPDGLSEKYLTYQAIAGEIIGEAEGGDSRAGGYVGDVADWEVANTPAVGQNVAEQFEANAKTGEAAGSGTAVGESVPRVDPVTGEAAPPTDFSLEFPRFCGWAPTVCEAAQTVITFPSRVQSWVTDLLGLGQRVEQEQKATTAEAAKTAAATQEIADILKKEDDLPQRDTTDILLPDVPVVPQTVNLSWGKSCPAPEKVTISFGGQSRDITILNYQFICEWAWIVEYSVISLASISSVFIVAGRKS